MNQTIKITDKNRLSVPLIYDRDESEWWLFIHSNNEHISGYDWNGVVLKSQTLYTISNSVRSYQLLPSPYLTDCIDYSQAMAAKSRNDCVRKCKVRLSLEKCGVVSDEIDVYSGEENVVFAKTKHEITCTRREKLEDICWKECPHNDCFEQYMEARIIQSSDVRYDKLRLMIPFEPRTTFRHKPCIQVIEFLCYLASTLSLWFGFSVISVYFWIKDLTMLIKEKRIKHFQVNNYFKSNSLNASKKIFNISLK